MPGMCDQNDIDELPRGPPMNTDDKARLRDLLANNHALLAYIRTAVSFAGLGFAVAKFGLNPRTQNIWF